MWFKVEERLYLRYYIKDYSNQLSCFFYLMELNAVILVGLYNVFSLQLISSNIFFVEALMTCLAYFALSTYLARRKVEMHLTRAVDVTHSSQALIFLDYLSQLITMSRDLSDDVTLTMIRQRHIMQCIVPNCFCTEHLSKS